MSGVHKGYTNMNMVSVFGKWNKSLSKKQPKLTFQNQIRPKYCYSMPFVDKKATGQKNHAIVISSIKAILKTMNDTLFLKLSFWVVRFFLCGEVCSTRESTLVLTGWALSWLKGYNDVNVRIANGWSFNREGLLLKELPCYFQL